MLYWSASRDSHWPPAPAMDSMMVSVLFHEYLAPALEQRFGPLQVLHGAVMLAIGLLLLGCSAR